eukprot:TRINITY_DN3603_c0_g1_i2.p1 TRINITY_DN3603_c0_g1~~TRINITY_DN3603_c0_g1_i2.p1  ORF type:complete len:154 (+),score=28.13 TRINITY_DN3603_c0_g1_i2:70-531(+)
MNSRWLLCLLIGLLCSAIFVTADDSNELADLNVEQVSQLLEEHHFHPRAVQSLKQAKVDGKGLLELVKDRNAMQNHGLPISDQLRLRTLVLSAAAAAASSSSFSTSLLSELLSSSGSSSILPLAFLVLVLIVSVLYGSCAVRRPPKKIDAKAE